MRGRTLAIVLALCIPAAPAWAGGHDDDEDDDQAAEPAARDADDPDEGSGDDADTDDAGDDDAEPRARAKAKAKAKQAKQAKQKPKKARQKAKDADADADADSDAPAAEVSARANAVAARDERPPRAFLAAEALGAAPLDGGNRDLFGMGGGVGLGADVYLSPWLGVHAGGAFVFLATGAGMSSTTWVGAHAGPRLHVGPALFGALTRNDAWVDAHVTFGSSGGIRRPGFDVGAAVQWEVSKALRIGPMVRYQFGFDPRDANAQVVTLGLAIGYGGRTRVAIHVEGDRDGDGVADRDDKCPEELPGEKPDPDRAGCPVRDGDGDGVVDAEDQCPDDPQGKKPDPVKVGCPFADRDGDSIADDADKCPDDAGPARPLEETHGCPLARVAKGKIEILQQIFFEHNSATIVEDSTPVLWAVAGVMKKLEDVRVRIEGHTDETGTLQYNLDLSKRRARAVAQWLIENGGIAPKRLETEGYGKSRPLVSGPTADTGKNRRVEFTIIEEP